MKVLAEYPAPVVKWKVLAALGQLLKSAGKTDEARRALTEAREIVEYCASKVSDDDLRSIFLNSKAVQEVMNGC